jgi:hypothetical protein
VVNVSCEIHHPEIPKNSTDAIKWTITKDCALLGFAFNAVASEVVAIVKLKENNLVSCPISEIRMVNG